MFVFAPRQPKVAIRLDNRPAANHWLVFAQINRTSPRKILRTGLYSNHRVGAKIYFLAPPDAEPWLRHYARHDVPDLVCDLQ